MNICAECKSIDKLDSPFPFHWKCRCKAKRTPRRDPVTGDDRSKFNRVQLCCDANKDGKCDGFERKGEERTISAEEFAVLVRKERDRYFEALQRIRGRAIDGGAIQRIVLEALEGKQ